jgi:hypothetical protein
MGAGQEEGPTLDAQIAPLQRRVRALRGVWFVLGLTLVLTVYGGCLWVNVAPDREAAANQVLAAAGGLCVAMMVVGFVAGLVRRRALRMCLDRVGASFDLPTGPRNLKVSHPPGAHLAFGRSAILLMYRGAPELLTHANAPHLYTDGRCVWMEWVSDDGRPRTACVAWPLAGGKRIARAVDEARANGWPVEDVPREEMSEALRRAAQALRPLEWRGVGWAIAWVVVILLPLELASRGVEPMMQRGPLVSALTMAGARVASVLIAILGRPWLRGPSPEELRSVEENLRFRP